MGVQSYVYLAVNNGDKGRDRTVLHYKLFDIFRNFKVIWTAAFIFFEPARTDTIHQRTVPRQSQKNAGCLYGYNRHLLIYCLLNSR